MRRSGLFLLVVGALAISAEGRAQQQQRLNQGQQPPPQQQAPPPQNSIPSAFQQMQGVITDFYISEFRNAFGLTDEQFIKLNPPLRRFMMQRFQLALEKANVDQQMDRMATTQNVSPEEADLLLMEKTRIERQMVNVEQRLLEMIRPDLSPQQQIKVAQFNKKFFDEQLRKLIEKAREAPRPGQPPQDRPNQNKQQNNPRRPNAPPVDSDQQRGANKQKAL
jgi:uncharacterized protein (DUF305 family)